MPPRHHCPGASGPVNGDAGNCRRSHNGTHCTRHQNWCPIHKYAFMKGTTCGACDRGLRSKKGQNNKKDGDDKDGDKATVSSIKTAKVKGSKVTKNSGKKSNTTTSKDGKKAAVVKATAMRLARGGVGINFTRLNITRLLNTLSAKQLISIRSQVNVAGLDDVLPEA